MIKELFTRGTISDERSPRLASLICFGTAILLPVVVFRKLADLGLSGIELSFCFLATLSVAMICTAFGCSLNSR